MRVFLMAAVAIPCALGCVVPQATYAASVLLNWTATGDDSISGRATAYDLRYSTAPISLANFGSAMGVPSVPPPAPTGTRESFTVTGLQANTTYYFAIKARDEMGNWSLVSNVVSKPANGTVDVPYRVPLGFSIPRPNPARSGALFVVSLPAATKIDVEAFDVQGRKVRVLADAEYPAGQKALVWDLFDDRGVRVAAGLYRVRARIGDATFSRSVVVVR